MISPGTGNGKKGRCPSCAAGGRHTREDLEQFHPQRAEFERATQAVNFTKEFNAELEAIMGDQLETVGNRFMAWVKRKSWGNFSLYCVDQPDGRPLIQQDCADQLGIVKQLISKAAAYKRSRGYLVDPQKVTCSVDELPNALQPEDWRRVFQKVTCSVDKLLIPTIAPALAIPSDEDPEPEWTKFVDGWKVTHSFDWTELEEARSVVKRIRKVMLSDYKRSRAAGTNAAAINYKEENGESNENDGARTQPAEADAGEDAGVPLPRLAGLRELFRDELLRDERLEALDRYLTAKLPEEGYQPAAYVAFVAARATAQPIQSQQAFGLAHGLPRDFILEMRRAHQETASQPLPRLAGLREIFPDEVLRDERLVELDSYLSARLIGEEYSPAAYVAFVAARARAGKVKAGLAFALESGLPLDFILDTKKAGAALRTDEQRQIEYDLRRQTHMEIEARLEQEANQRVEEWIAEHGEYGFDQLVKAKFKDLKKVYPFRLDKFLLEEAVRDVRRELGKKGETAS